MISKNVEYISLVSKMKSSIVVIKNYLNPVAICSMDLLPRDGFIKVP